MCPHRGQLAARPFSHHAPSLPADIRQSDSAETFKSKIKKTSSFCFHSCWWEQASLPSLHVVMALTPSVCLFLLSVWMALSSPVFAWPALPPGSCTPTPDAAPARCPPHSCLVYILSSELYIEWFPFADLLRVCPFLERDPSSAALSFIFFSCWKGISGEFYLTQVEASEDGGCCDVQIVKSLEANCDLHSFLYMSVLAA